MIDYRSKVKNHIIEPLGDMKMGDVTADDIRLAIIPASSFQPLFSSQSMFCISAFLTLLMRAK